MPWEEIKLLREGRSSQPPLTSSPGSIILATVEPGIASWGEGAKWCYLCDGGGRRGEGAWGEGRGPDEL